MVSDREQTSESFEDVAESLCEGNPTVRKPEISAEVFSSSSFFFYKPQELRVLVLSGAAAAET